MSILVLLAVLLVSALIDFGVVVFLYKVAAWAFGIAFSWPIAIFIALVVFVVPMLFTRH